MLSNGPCERWVRGGLIVLTIAGAIVLGSASFGYAKGEYKYWPTSGGNITVTAYGSTVYAHGQWRVADSPAGTRSWLDSLTSYYNADDHRKYATFITQVGNTAFGPWADHAGDNTNTSNVTSWQWLYADTSVNGANSWARAKVKACLDVPFLPNPCGPSWTYTGSTSY
jgi:hypothetical protein